VIESEIGDTCPILKDNRSLMLIQLVHVTKTAILLGASTLTVSKVMLAYMIHGKTTAAKRNSGQK
jgi:hypothetical protein